ncbi:hypothetical protein CDL15_Pgr008560 [Punica granatum]|nr:hypothetical protein CDL15_Pgr008560 [Punica granatum]
MGWDRTAHFLNTDSVYSGLIDLQGNLEAQSSYWTSPRRSPFLGPVTPMLTAHHLSGPPSGTKAQPTAHHLRGLPSGIKAQPTMLSPPGVLRPTE